MQTDELVRNLRGIKDILAAEMDRIGASLEFAYLELPWRLDIETSTPPQPRAALVIFCTLVAPAKPAARLFLPSLLPLPSDLAGPPPDLPGELSQR
jgi:hypothetical protein